MHFLFILQSLYNSKCFKQLFRSSSGVHNLLYLRLCTNHSTIPNCSILRLELPSAELKEYIQVRKKFITYQNFFIL